MITTGRNSRLEPALSLAATPATITSLVVAHVTMRTEMPTPVLIAAIFLSIVLPKIRRTVIAILSLLYGLAFLLIGIVRPNHHGDNLMQGLAKITSTLTGDPLPEWALAQAPAVSVSKPIPAVIPAPVGRPIAKPTSEFTPAARPAVKPTPTFTPATAALPTAKTTLAATPETRNGHRSAPAEQADILPAVHDALDEREPLYDATFTNLAECRPNGPSDVVVIESSVADTLPDMLADRRQPRGRHAKARQPELAQERATA